MNIILIVTIPVTLLVVVFFVGLYVWAVLNGQFDDMETPALRILNDSHEEKGQP